MWSTKYVQSYTPLSHIDSSVTFEWGVDLRKYMHINTCTNNTERPWTFARDGLQNMYSLSLLLCTLDETYTIHDDNILYTYWISKEIILWSDFCGPLPRYWWSWLRCGTFRCWCWWQFCGGWPDQAVYLFFLFIELELHFFLWILHNIDAMSVNYV